jgi:5-methylcytosine-specific restriction endonuclease McrA
MQTKIEHQSDAIAASSHWLQDMPYRALVPISVNQHGVILYQIAGNSSNACGPETALRKAVATFGAECFYCKKSLVKKDNGKDYNWTLDHVEPLAHGGKSTLSNFVITCPTCNRLKADQVIDACSPKASEEWLTNLRNQIDARLNKLRSPITRPSSPPRPKQAAKVGL